MTRSETAQLLALLAIEYRNEVIDQPRIDLWAELFRDVAFEDGKAAVLEWLTDTDRGRFFPRPAELRALIRATHPTLDTGLYRAYARLRQRYQDGTLTEADERQLQTIERRLGIEKLGRAA